METPLRSATFGITEVMPQVCTLEECFLMKKENEKQSRRFIKRKDNLVVEAHFNKDV